MPDTNGKAPAVVAAEALDWNRSPRRPQTHPSALRTSCEAYPPPASREVVAWALAAFYASLRDGGDFAEAFARRFAALRYAGLPRAKNPSNNALGLEANRGA